MEFIKETELQGKHYLYIHKRNDTNNVFYVGIGTKYSHNKDYSRAKTIKGRNKIWQSIIKKTDYSILIKLETDDYSIVKDEEINLIKIYGQIINNTGTLANITKGGDGCLGYRNEKLFKSVFLYTKNGEYYKEFVAISDCTKFLQTSKSVVSLAINKEFLIKGFIVKDYKTDKVEPALDIKEKLKLRLSKPVYQYDINYTLLNEWISTSEASRVLNISGGHIRECCSQKLKTYKNFIWSYTKY